MGAVADDPRVTGTEAALLGELRVSEVDAWLGRALELLTGARLSKVLFRSGRIDAVYGVLTTDDRRLVLKVHRPPVDMEMRTATAVAQQTLAAAGFPCAVPVAAATSIDGRVVTVETLLDDGLPGNRHDPAVRAAIAASLAEQIHLLGPRPELVAAGGFHTHGTTEGAQQAEPGEVLAFLIEFEQAWGAPFDAGQRAAAGGAATWSICYTARCHLQMLTGQPEPGSPLDALRRHGDDYLALRW